MQARATVLGYIQRGGTPTARDRVLGLRFGLEAADLVVRRASSDRWPPSTATRCGRCRSSEATAELKLVPESWYVVAKTFFG